MKSMLLSAACVMLMFTVTSSTASASVLWGSSIHDGNLVEIDTTTGAATVVGAFRSYGISGLCYDPARDRLYGLDRDDDTLVKISTVTGFAHTVGPLGVSTSAAGLTYDVLTDTIYFSCFTDRNIYKVDKITGAATLIGPHDVPNGYMQGLAYDWNTNTLYGSDSRTNSLYTIDTTTGHATLVGSLGIITVDNGLAFDNGNNILYLVEAQTSQTPDNKLYTINTTTGHATVVGSLGVSVQGLAFKSPVPEPASLMLLSLGSLAILRSRR